MNASYSSAPFSEQQIAWGHFLEQHPLAEKGSKHWPNELTSEKTLVKQPVQWEQMTQMRLQWLHFDYCRSMKRLGQQLQPQEPLLMEMSQLLPLVDLTGSAVLSQ